MARKSKTGAAHGSADRQTADTVPSESTKQTGKGFQTSAFVTLEDANRLMQAFERGELNALGVTDVRIVDVAISRDDDGGGGRKAWSQSEKLRKRSQRSDDGIDSP